MGLYPKLADASSTTYYHGAAAGAIKKHFYSENSRVWLGVTECEAEIIAQIVQSGFSGAVNGG